MSFHTYLFNLVNNELSWREAHLLNHLLHANADSHLKPNIKSKDMLNQKDLYSYAMKGVNPFVVKQVQTVDIRDGYYGDLDIPYETTPGKFWNACPPGFGKTTDAFEKCKNRKTCFIFPTISLKDQNNATLHPEVNASNIDSFGAYETEFELRKKQIETQYENIEVVQLEHFIKMEDAQLEEFDILVFDEFQLLVEDSYREAVELAVERINWFSSIRPVYLLSATLEDNMIMFDIDIKIVAKQGFPQKDVVVAKLVAENDDGVKKSTRSISNVLASMWYKHRDNKDFRLIPIFNSDAVNERIAENNHEIGIETEVVSSDRNKNGKCIEYKKMLETKDSRNMGVTCIAATGLMESGVSDLNPDAHIVTEQCYPPKIVQRVGRTRNNNVSTIVIGTGDEPLKFEYAPFVESVEAAKDLGLCTFKNRIHAWLCDTSKLNQQRAQRTKHGKAVLAELQTKYNFNVVDEYFIMSTTQGLEKGSRPKFVEAVLKNIEVGKKQNIKDVWDIDGLMKLTGWKRSTVRAHSDAYMSLLGALKRLKVERDFKLNDDEFELINDGALISLSAETNEVYANANQSVIDALDKLNIKNRLSKIYDILGADVQAIHKSIDLYNKAYNVAKRKASSLRAEYRDELKELKDSLKELKKQEATFKRELENILNLPDDNKLMTDFSNRYTAFQEQQEDIKSSIDFLDAEAKKELEAFNDTASYPLYCLSVTDSLDLGLSKSDAMRFIEIIVGSNIAILKKTIELTTKQKKALQRKLSKLNISPAKREEFEKHTGKTATELAGLELDALREFADKFFGTEEPEQENFINQIKF